MFFILKFSEATAVYR